MLTILLIAALTASEVAGQITIADYNIKSERQERLSEKHWILSGSVELERGATKVYADTIEYLEDQEKVIARGNVVYSEGANRIAADSAEFSTKTSLGTFYHASGISPLQPQQQRGPTLGIAVPQASGLDTDVTFFGEKVEKLGAKKYRITNGGFTTCVQPTSRWDLSADTIILNIDDYTLLRQAVMRVKGVPVFYLPVLYFPTQEDGRATGFLLPTYGQSKRRGHNISNAFFWAINRSMDATFTHDWYSKTGTGAGVEYRYVAAPGSDGNFTAYRLDEHAATYQTDGGLVESQALTSFTLNGAATHVFPGRVYARARVNYFSSIVTNQTFNVDINTASSNTRDYGANVVGSWRSYSINGTFDRREFFGATTSSAVNGTSPRITVNRNERPLFTNSPVYFSANADFAHLDRQTRESDVVVDDRSLAKLEFFPQIRYPFKRWQWFTVNTTANWRGTVYSRSLDPADANTIVDEGVARGFFTVGADLVGPVLTRVWNTPNNGYAERFKHTIEPFLNLQRTSSIDVRDRIIQIDSNDSVYGDTTRLWYGVNNRFYAKRRIGTVSQAQEILAVEVGQTYYSNPGQALVDPRYTTSYAGGPPSNFSVVQVNTRVTPTQNVNATIRGEIDPRALELRTLNANGNFNLSQRLQTTVGWSHKFFIEGLSGYDDPSRLDHYLNFAVNARTADNRYGLNTSFNFDVLNSTMTQQRISGFYNAQCCGFAIEYQKYSSIYVLSSDQRFFFSFSLAGLGNFSPMSGGLSGLQR